MITLAAIALLGIAAQAPQPGFELFGKQVVPVAPPVGSAEFSPEVAAWKGWASLHSKPIGPLLGPFATDGDWAPVLKEKGALQPEANAVPWRVKVLLLSSVDFFSPDKDGNLLERRTGIYGPSRDRIAQGLALAAAKLQARAAGRLAVSYDATEDSTLYEETVAEGAGLGSEALRAYVAPRINGGSFEANDKLYHGPYHLCLVIHAGLCKAASCTINATPIVSIPAPADDENASRYAEDVYRAFALAATECSRRHGREPAPAEPAQNVEPFGTQTPDQIASDADFAPPAGAAISEALRAGPFGWPPVPRSGDPIATMWSPASSNTQLSVADDPDKGSILTAKIGGTFATGGFIVPTELGMKELVAKAEHFLVFDARTSATEPLSLGVLSGSGLSNRSVSLGPPQSQGMALPLPRDGAWHQVAVDLTKFGVSADSDRLYIGFPPDAALRPKNSILATEYSFANFALAAKPPDGSLTVDDVSAPEWWLKLSELRAAMKAGSGADPGQTIAQALADPD